MPIDAVGVFGIQLKRGVPHQRQQANQFLDCLCGEHTVAGTIQHHPQILVTGNFLFKKTVAVFRLTAQDTEFAPNLGTDRIQHRGFSILHHTAWCVSFA